MRKLIQGIIQFREKHLARYREEYAHLAYGQAPDALFIACSDSRVTPNVFASTNPGDLFSIRNMGNLVPPCHGTLGVSSEAAAIEFSLEAFPIRNVIVCGHSECGAMSALLSTSKKTKHVKRWLCGCGSSSLERLERCPGLSTQLPIHNRLAQANVLEQMDHVRTYPRVKERLKEGTLQVHGWYFDIKTGDVYAYEAAVEQFILIDEAEAKSILDRMR